MPKPIFDILIRGTRALNISRPPLASICAVARNTNLPGPEGKGKKVQAAEAGQAFVIQHPPTGIGRGNYFY